MNDEKLKQVCNEAVHHAISYVQNYLGTDAGDFAGLWFTGDNGDRLKDFEWLLVEYAQSERREGESDELDN